MVGGWLDAGFHIKCILIKGLHSSQYYQKNKVVQRLNK